MKSSRILLLILGIGIFVSARADTCAEVKAAVEKLKKDISEFKDTFTKKITSFSNTYNPFKEALEKVQTNLKTYQSGAQSFVEGEIPAPNTPCPSINAELKAKLETAQKSFDATKQNLLNAISKYKEALQKLLTYLNISSDQFNANNALLKDKIVALSDDLKKEQENKQNEFQKRAEEIRKKAGDIKDACMQDNLKNLATALTEGNVTQSVTSLKNIGNTVKTISAIPSKVVAVSGDKVLDEIGGALGVNLPKITEITKKLENVSKSISSAASSVTKAFGGGGQTATAGCDQKNEGMSIIMSNPNLRNKMLRNGITWSKEGYEIKKILNEIYCKGNCSLLKAKCPALGWRAYLECCRDKVEMPFSGGSCYQKHCGSTTEAAQKAESAAKSAAKKALKGFHF
ncbi:TPA: hypothetical protein DIC20_01480 [Candidatus Dependentiae bacterium]|nr:MAG: hypothetical protein US03_C0008G0037 [candidate division TM6 bacterium GW2011_GWF2_36_131]KKQ02928.1 MAG: hypothetical protein US13_C0008G0001 [candidate division TM6 bacterium GW2011_GWE2_36_25]KKQ19703.1 MAG: hypothetical protein US32_C0006G0037 [candidate division TM6 bacterium GW2011_GWA2_36_9]HBR70966.1 hypothetical protein [Candidatus Dependentiae bacterium]HCU00357.1 hypothetical protein [Candidatus Dependentiae bacterium]